MRRAVSVSLAAILAATPALAASNLIQDVAHGGTAATNAASARANLGAAASGANSDITSLSGVANQPNAVYTYGAICNGQSNPLSATFSTLAAAQAAYPAAIALTDETDWAALTELVSAWRASLASNPFSGMKYDASGLGNCVINRTFDLTNFRSYNGTFVFSGTREMCYGAGVICVDNAMAEFGTFRDLSISGLPPPYVISGGTGWTASGTGTATWSGPGCIVNPVVNIATDVNGLMSVTGVNTAGSCSPWPSAGTTWTITGVTGGVAPNIGVGPPNATVYPPYLGLFIGRDNTNDRCNNNTYENLTVVRYYTFAAVDNFACEVNTFLKPTVSNSAPNAFGWVQDGMNHWGIASPTMGNTAPQNVANSLYSDIFVGGSSTVTGAGSTPVWLATTSSNRFESFYTTATGAASATKANVDLYSYKSGDENQGLQWLSHTEGGRTGNAAFFLFTGPNTTQNVMNMTYTDSGYGALVNHLAADTGITSVNLPGFKYDVGNLHSGEKVVDQPSVYTVQGEINLGNATSAASWNLPSTSWSGCLTVAGAVRCQLSGTMQPTGQNVTLSGGGINVTTAGSIASLTATSNAGYGGNTSGVYTFPTLAISLPDVVGGTQATASITAWGLYAAPDAAQDGGSWPPGGTGYSVNDVLTVPGGTCAPQPQIKLLTVDGNGGGLTWAKQTVGSCSVAPSMPVSLTGGTGTGATLSRVAWTPLTYSVTNNGTGYISPTYSFSAGTYNNSSNAGIAATVTPGPYLINGNPLAFGIAPASNDAQYISLFPTVATTGVASPTQNNARCAAFVAQEAEHVDQLSMTVTTLGTGPLNVALYSDAIDTTTHRHQPQAAIGSGSFVVTAAATVQAAIGTNGVGVPLSAGINWACINDTNAADAVRFTAMSGTSTFEANLIGSNSAANVTSASANLSSLLIGQTAGTWPSFVGSTFSDSAGVAMPLLGARIASVP